MNVIDLRSDTVTHPTPAMRQAMATAVLGDDVYGDDPTVNQLEQDAADMFGKEAGLFVTSGTQGNLIAMLTHCPRGSEIICGDKAHTFVYEQAGMSALGGIMPHTIPVQTDGTLSLDMIQKAIRGDNEHFPRTKLITIENTQGTVGGVPLSPTYTQRVADLAHQHGLQFHIDGARIFNAATAFKASAAEITAGADSVTFCLSKGLCAPAGSILVGSKTFIKEARRVRKVLGGGMRQTGVLAAAGLIAIHEMSKRLQEDHDNATYMAESLSDINGITMMHTHTNFVFFELEEKTGITPKSFEEKLREQGIIMRPYPGFERVYRCVLHYWVNREKVDAVVTAIKTVVA